MQLVECRMPQPNDLSRSLDALQQDSTLVAVIEMSQSRWLVAGAVPGLERHPLKTLAPDGGALEDARAGRGGAASAASAPAGRSRAGRAQDHAHRGGLRSRPRWRLAGALAAG